MLSVCGRRWSIDQQPCIRRGQVVDRGLSHLTVHCHFKTRSSRAIRLRKPRRSTVRPFFRPGAESGPSPRLACAYCGQVPSA